MRVSVCMATYRGAEFVGEQIASILPQLSADDELVIVDDASPDDTVEVVRAIGDPRIKLFARDHNLGYVRTFGEALTRASGDFLLLSDQDDVWSTDHVAVLVAGLRRSQVVASNLATLGGPDMIGGPYGQADWKLRPADSGRRIRNIVGILAGNRPYYGCAMGLRADALRIASPIPEFLHESHDLWFALYGNLADELTHLPQRTVLRRFHGDNQTPDRPRGIAAVLASRARLVRCTLILASRLIRQRRFRNQSAHN